MAHNYNFSPDPIAGEELTAADLVLLYKNTDPHSLQLMPDAEGNKIRRSNQHVETVVYDGNDSDTTDTSDASIPEDLQHYLLTNEEQIDIFGCTRSNESRLTHKLGELALQLSNLTVHYDQQLKDSYIKNHLHTLNFNCMDSCPSIANNFLDYIHSKRVDDDHSFYMENVINYVNNTIEQLKRISNGDYLSPRAQAKWRQINGDNMTDKSENDLKVLIKSFSIPSQITNKVSDQLVKWEDFMHSEVDVRSLSKMLHKRIVIEIPRLIYDARQLFSEHYEDSLIISCQSRSESKEVANVKSANSVDVMYQLKSTDDYRTNSTVRFQGTALSTDSVRVKELLPVTVEDNQVIDNDPKVIELCEQNTLASDFKETSISQDPNLDELYTDFSMQLVNDDYNEGYQKKNNKVSEPLASSEDDASNLSDASSNANGFLGTLHEMKKTEPLVSKIFFNPTPPDDLNTTLQNLNIQCPLPEENFDESFAVTSMKKKITNDRCKAKSPYENGKNPIEETKRKRLLEIRDKRERRKNTVAIENSKFAKYKMVKSFPLSSVCINKSHSVTKLSITNKSFYNSIYGNANNAKPPKQEENKERNKKQRKPATLENTLKRLDIESVQEECTSLPADHNSHRFDMDETVTEMMYLQMKRDALQGYEEKFISSPSASASAASGYDAIDNLHILSPNAVIPDLYGPPDAKVPAAANKCQDSKSAKRLQSLRESVTTYNENMIPISNIAANTVKLAYADGPKANGHKKTTPTECRKSIDKIYNLMKKMSNTGNGNTRSVTKPPAYESFTSHVSDTESNVSHEKTSKYKDTHRCKLFNSKKTDLVPKVIISTKSQSTKMESDDKKKSILKERKRVTINPSNRTHENPLKIAMLLQGFDGNGQRQALLERFTSNLKKHDDKNKPAYTRKSTLTQDYDRSQRLGGLDECVSPREKRTTKHKESHIDNLKKNMADLTDEAREARGEAVRGPSKHSPARLNALAQPKRSYVQAHSEEFQRRYGRNLMADRLQRLANTGMPTMLQHAGSASKAEKKKIDKTVNLFCGKSHSPTRELINSHYEASSTLTSDQPSKKIPVLALQDPRTKTVAFESRVKCHYGDLRISKGKLANTRKESAVLSLNDDTAASGSYSDEDDGSDKTWFEDTSMLCHVGSMSDENTFTSFSKSDFEKNLDTDNTSEIVDSERPLERIPENSLLLVSSNTVMSTNETHNNKVNANDYSNDLENFICRTVTSGVFGNCLNSSGANPSKNSIILVSSCTSLRLSSDAKLSKRSDPDQLSVMEMLPVLPNSNLHWSFTNLPIRISTVGYAFPQCKTSNSSIESRVIYDASNKDKSESYFKTKRAKKNIDEVKNARISESDKIDEANTVIVKSATYFVEQDYDTTLYDRNMEQNESNHAVSVSSEQCPYRIDTSDIVNIPSDDFENIDCTSSLDILIKLLNEIKSISSCQAHITTDFNLEGDKMLSMEGNIALTHLSSTGIQDDSCKVSTGIEGDSCKLPTGIEDDSCKLISNNAADNQTHIKSTDNISIIRPPNYDVMNKRRDANLTDELNNSCGVVCTLFYNDKEANVGLSKKSRMDIFTNVPSTQFIPVVANRATNVPHSQLTVFSQLSSHSMISLNEFYLGKTWNDSHNKIMEVPLFAESKIYISNDISDDQSNCTTVVYQHGEMNHSVSTKKELDKDEEDSPVRKSKEIKNYKCKEKLQDSIKHKNDYDPLIKIKREILVTVYSILALTVFGALSFSDILYHV